MLVLHYIFSSYTGQWQWSENAAILISCVVHNCGYEDNPLPMTVRLGSI